MSDVSGPGSVFGGGLDTQSGAPAYSGDGSGSLPDTPVMPNVGPAPAAPPSQASTPTFGSSFVSPFPNYNTPDPAATALDQTSGLLQQRITRANQIAASPLAQIFAPESVQAARDAVPKMTEQLQQIKTQKAAVQAGRAQAQTLGLTPDEAPDQATMEDRLEIASNKALKGDLRAFQGIQAVAPDKAAAIAPQVVAAIGGHLDNAQRAFDSLSGMENEGQYQAKIQQLRSEGTLTDLESAGLKLPPTFDAFKAAAPSEALALRNARAALNAQGQAVEARNTYVPMETKEQETYKGALKTVDGDELNLGPWSRNGASGTRGQLANGIATVDDYGKTGSGATPDQRKELTEAIAAAVPKQDMEKYRAFNRIYQVATTDAKGNALPEGKINTNPNVQQGIAEGLASMLRGGTGGANVGLLRIEGIKRGAMQSLFDTITSNYAGTLDTLSGEQVRPYLTGLTQSQIRDVMDVLKGYNDSSIGDRTAQIAHRAGALGLNASALGLGQEEANGPIGAAIEEGRQAQIERMRPYFQPIGSGNGVLQLGAQRPGAGPISLPPGSQPANQLPGAQPLLTPVQQAGQNNGANGAPLRQRQPAPPNSAPGGAGQPTQLARTQAAVLGLPQNGGAALTPQPITVAGQQVNVALPPGASPAYVASLQRIETGNERSPWTATTKSTSAGGAFQAVKGTWDQFKPAGAPEQAKDATPQQQADFLSRLTTANAASLQSAGIPVNDTSLYVAHNLGADGAAALLRADPNVDARTVVGGTAAKNNSRFFKGRPTVATVLQRYADAMSTAAPINSPGGVASSTQTVPPLPGAEPTMGNPMDDPATMAWNHLTPAQQEQGRQGGIDMIAGAAPAALSTAGAFTGALTAPVTGPFGAIGGGAVGGAAGTMLKNYIRGKPQSALETTEQAALGGALGVASATRPFVAAGARMLGSGAIEAGTEAARGGSGADVVDAGVRGAAEAAGGEAFGRALGMAGHKVFSLFAPDAKAAVQDAAKTYAETSAILKTEPNRLPGVGAAAGGPNPKYLAAEQANGEAATKLKDAGLDPEEAAYAHTVSSQAVPLQEAQVNKPGALEQKSIGAGYQQLEADVASKGVGAVKATPKLPDGPMAAVANKQVSAAHAELAERTEMAITAPAANWQEKWNQLKDARSNLLQAERDALGSTATGKTQTAADMRTLADTVRTQQAKAANYVFGPTQGPQVMQRLNALDVRYRRLMDATNGGDLAQAANMKGEAGREADRRFRAFAANDPTAVAAWDAMRKSGTNYEKGVYNLVAAERIPYLGKVYSGVKMLGSLNKWVQDRTAGSPAKFSDIINAMPETGARTTRSVAGTIAQRGAVQGAGASP
jgi:hypothetical protein